MECAPHLSRAPWHRPAAIVLFSLLTVIAAAAPASAAPNFDAACDLPELPAPVRQTLLILDEAQVVPETDQNNAPGNAAWRSFLGNLLPEDSAALERHFLPREHLSIVLARRDGAGLRTIFSGCVPFFSGEETRTVRQRAGAKRWVDSFFGLGPLADARKNMAMFRARLSGAVKNALQPSMLSPAGAGPDKDLAANGLVRSLKQGNPVVPAYGIARIIIFSDMSRLLADFPADLVKVRELGLEKARAAELNLGGAEVYVSGMSGSPVARAALDMFFLASYGELVGASAASSLPAFAPAPVRLLYFQGTSDYPGVKYPLRLRLAVAQGGTVVNSWVSVKTSRDQFSPFHGLLTCHTATACSYTGDDVFAARWNARRSVSPEPDGSLPFGGARGLHFELKGNTVTGSISDPQIIYKDMEKTGIRFVAIQQSGFEF